MLDSQSAHAFNEVVDQFLIFFSSLNGFFSTPLLTLMEIFDEKKIRNHEKGIKKKTLNVQRFRSESGNEICAVNYVEKIIVDFKLLTIKAHASTQDHRC